MISYNSRLSIKRWRHASAFRRHVTCGGVTYRTLQQNLPGRPSVSDWAEGHGLGAARRQLSSANLKFSQASDPTRSPTQREPTRAAAGVETLCVPRRGRVETLTELRAQAEKRKSKNEPQSTSTVAVETTTPTLARRWQTLRKMTSSKELKRLMKQYGPVALAFHSTVFLSTLGGFYAVLDYGFDVQSIVARIPFLAENTPHPTAGNLALAWGLTTCTGPVRGIMTITISPQIARTWWGREARRKLSDDNVAETAVTSSSVAEEQEKDSETGENK